MQERDSKYSQDLKKAVETLKKGGIILYPTDTIWGIGCDATDPKAVKRIYELKKRADSKSMLVLVNNEAMLERTVKEIPEVAWQLIEAADKPLTVIYDEPVGMAPELTASDGSLGIRITKERFSSDLCRLLRRPIVSTSANISGEASAATFSEISQKIRDGVDYIAKYRRDDMSRPSPSNIIKLGNDGTFRIIR